MTQSRPDKSGRRGESIFVLDDIGQHIGIFLNFEIEPICVIHSRLPNIACLVIFLGAKRWMPKIYQKKCDLFCNFRSDILGQADISVVKRRQGIDFHRFRLRNLINSSAVSKGP